jgi:hypothetical protein
MRVISSNITRMYWARSGTSTPSSFSIAMHVGVLVAHHRHVVETVHVGHRLQEGARLGQLLGAAMQQADVRVGALDDLAVEFQHQAQHAVRRRGAADRS